MDDHERQLVVLVALMQQLHEGANGHQGILNFVRGACAQQTEAREAIEVFEMRGNLPSLPDVLHFD